jgi:hypothetical protein
MNNKFLAVLFLVLITTCPIAMAQEENEYSTETVFGVDLNTNGGLIGGFMFRHTRELTGGRYFNYGAEWVQVKHPNEVRIPNSVTGSVFILGKTNYFFPLRPHVGYEFVLFTKGKEDGIQVDALINGGPSFGFVKPYYIQFDNGTSIDIVPYNVNAHDPATKGAGIIGPGGFFHGFDNIRVVPGMHLKTGLSFEFGAFNSGVSGIEAGTLLEAFTQKIDILDVSSSYPTHNKWFFSSVYVNIYIGGRR